MVITTNAKNRIRDLIADDVIEMAVGTDGTGATVSDTDLGAEITAVTKVPTIEIGAQTITLSTDIYSTEANGEVIKEMGIKITGDILLDRAVFPDFDKSDLTELTVIDIINIL